MAEISKASEPTPPESITREELAELLSRAEKGDKSCLLRLRAVFQAEGDGRRRGGLLELYGNPPTWLRSALVKNASGGDLAISEASHVRMDQLRRELEGPNPSQLERLLAERAVLCWFLVHTYEIGYAQANELTIRQAEFHQRRIDAAHRRFLSAVRTLAQVRKLALPALQVNIGANQVNMA
jgi:hypothetical protein